jgi:hypothetical protein
MNKNLSNVSNNVYDEQQTDVEDKLSLEEKLRIVKGLLLLFLFSSVGKNILIFIKNFISYLIYVLLQCS